jgi:hypothetical protein
MAAPGGDVEMDTSSAATSAKNTQGTGEDALLAAARSGDAARLQSLLQMTPKPAETALIAALHAAARVGEPGGGLCVSAVLEAAESKEQAQKWADDCRAGDEFGRTSLVEAIISLSLPAVTAFLAAGADVTAVGSDQLTPLHFSGFFAVLFLRPFLSFSPSFPPV